MLLTLDDFPQGWVHKPNDPSKDIQEATPDPSEPCVNSTYAGQTGKAIGGEFSDENTTLLSINPSVYVFDSAANAASAAQAIISSDQCFADTVGSGFDVSPSFAFGETHTEPLSAAAFGATAAIRLSETQIYKADQPPHGDVLVFDVVIVVDGRVLYEVDGFRRYTPIDQSLLGRYVDKARAKIRNQGLASREPFAALSLPHEL